MILRVLLLYLLFVPFHHEKGLIEQRKNIVMCASISFYSGISLFSSDTMTIKHKDAMSISSSSSGSSKPPRPAQALPSEVGIGSHSKLTQQQIEDLRRYEIIFFF